MIKSRNNNIHGDEGQIEVGHIKPEIQDYEAAVFEDEAGDEWANFMETYIYNCTDEIGSNEWHSRIAELAKFIEYRLDSRATEIAQERYLDERAG